MSSQAIELGESYSADYPSPDGEAFAYRPVPVLAVVSMALGVLSIMAFFGITGMFVAAIGIVISAISLLKIVASRGALGGRRLAMLGLACSALFLGSGMTYQHHLYIHEVPPGFERVSFATDIAKKEPFLVVDQQQRVNPEIEKLVGKPMFLKGFMFPTNQLSDIGSFLLVKDSKACCFGGDPAVTDMIGVVMQEGKTVDYYRGRVSVAGTFSLNTEYRGGKNEPLYLLEGNVVTKSKTAF